MKDYTHNLVRASRKTPKLATLFSKSEGLTTGVERVGWNWILEASRMRVVRQAR